MTTSIRSKLTYTQVASNTADKVVTFDVTAAFTPVAGDLPDGVTGVFVMQVLVPDDPKSDRFVRVATLADLGRVANTRELAIDDKKFYPAAGQYIKSRPSGASLLYLSAVHTAALDNTDVAVKYKTALEQRIDALISDWKYFRDVFFPRTEVEFPLGSSAPVTAARTAFHTAVTDYAAKLTAKKSSDTAYADANSALTALQNSRAQFAGLMQTVCERAPGHLATFLARYTAYFISGPLYRSTLRDAAVTAHDFLVTASASFGDAAKLPYTLTANQLRGALSTEDAGYTALDTSRLTHFNPSKADIEKACADLDALVDGLDVSIFTATTAVGASTSAQITANAAVSTSRTALTVAYSALMELCPSYVAETDKEIPEMGEWRTPILALLADTLS